MANNFDGNIKLGVSITTDAKLVSTELKSISKQIEDSFSNASKSLSDTSDSFSNLSKALNEASQDSKVLREEISKTSDVTAQSSTEAATKTEELSKALAEVRLSLEGIQTQKLSESYESIDELKAKVEELSNAYQLMEQPSSPTGLEGVYIDDKTIGNYNLLVGELYEAKIAVDTLSHAASEGYMSLAEYEAELAAWQQYLDSLTLRVGNTVLESSAVLEYKDVEEKEKLLEEQKRIEQEKLQAEKERVEAEKKIKEQLAQEALDEANKATRTDLLTTLTAQMDDYKFKLLDLLKLQKLLKDEMSKSVAGTGVFDASQYELAKNLLEQVNAKIKEINTPPKKTFGELLSEHLEGYQGKLLDLIQLQKFLKEQMRDAESGKGNLNADEYDDAKKLLTEVNLRIKELNGDLGTTKKETSKIAPEAQKVSEPFKRLTDTLKSVLSTLFNLGPAFQNLRKNSHQATNHMAKGFKRSFLTMIKYTFGVRSLYFLFRRLRTAATEAMQAIAASVPEFNKVMSEFKTATKNLQGAFGSALQPLAAALMPILTNLINMLTNVIYKVAELFALFTGQKVIYKATAAQQNFAKSLGKTNEELGKLGAYDKLNVIGDDKDKGSGSGAGGLTYSPAEIESGMWDIYQMIMDAWEKGDFFNIGLLIGEQINKGLDYLRTNVIPQIDALGIKLASSIATLFNGILSTEGLGANLGQTIGDAINVALHFLDTFFTKFDFKQLGTFIGNGLQSLFTEIDWGSVGRIFIEKKLWLYETITGFIQGVDWISLAFQIQDAIVQFVTGIDWGHVSEVIFEYLGSIVGGISAFLLGILATIAADVTQAFVGVYEYFDKYIQEAGGNIIQGLFNGVMDALKNIGTWINEHIFKPFMDGFKAAFGIHSPSTVMTEMGDYLIEGLMSPLKNLWEILKVPFEEAKNNLVSLWNNIKATVTSVVTTMKSSIVNVFNSMKTAVGNVFDSIWTKIKSILNNILNTMGSMVNGVINLLNKMINALNGVGFDVPWWVPAVGGKSLKFNLPTISNVSIPQLAQGAVIPPNRQFLAMLGDQKNGTNIEAPLDTIKQALAEVMAQTGSNQPIVLQLDGKTVAKVVWNENEKRYKQTGSLAY